MTFQPGISGNPGGKPRGLEGVRRVARAMSPRAIATLHYWMRQRDPKLAFASIAAANSLLDRAWGKPGTDPETAETISITIRKILEIAPSETKQATVTIDHQPTEGNGHDRSDDDEPKR